MTTCCRRCRLRFTPAAAAYVEACPDCGGSLERCSLDGTFGFRLFKVGASPDPIPQAIAVSLPVPDPRGLRP